MNEYTCNDCKKKFISNGPNIRIFDKNLLFFYCSNCIKNHKLYSKTTVLKKLHLKKAMLVNLKTLYIPNKRNIQNYYLQSDILTILNYTYANTDNYLEAIKLKQNKLQIKHNEKKIAAEIRKDNLIKAFNDNKLEFNYIGDCYAYINYGKPSIETIISNELTKLEEQNERRKVLAELLKNSKILLDNNVETIPLVNNYIKYSQGNVRNIVNSVKRIVTDHTNMQNNTNINNTNISNTNFNNITMPLTSQNKTKMRNHTMVISFN